MKLRRSASTNPNDNEFVNIATSFYYQLCAWRHNIPPSPASWQYLRIYSPGGTCSGVLAITRMHGSAIRSVRSDSRSIWNMANLTPLYIEND